MTKSSSVTGASCQHPFCSPSEVRVARVDALRSFLDCRRQVSQLQETDISALEGDEQKGWVSQTCPQREKQALFISSELCFDLS